MTITNGHTNQVHDLLNDSIQQIAQGWIDQLTALRDNAIDIALSLEPAEGEGKPVVLRATYSRKSSVRPLAAQWVERMVHFANDESLDDFLKRQPA